MADSDDEYDRRKARDKFRRERNDYDRRDDRRRDTWDHDRRGSGRSREVWSSRSGRDNRRDLYGRDYESRRRERFSPQRSDISPPHAKRIRRDWDDSGGYGGSHYDMQYGGPMHGGGGGPPPHGWGPGPDMGNMPPQQPQQFGNPNQGGREVDYPTQPAVMTFKQFLAQQDDNINDQDAIKKYNEYKVDFRRQQISEFFLAHKEEEWFKYKYHPEEYDKRQEEVRNSLLNRLKVFMELLDMGRVEGIMVDVDHSDDVIKLLDAAVIKMEGGDDFDLTVLDEPPPEDKEEGSWSRTNSESQAVEKSSPEEKKKKRKDSKDGKDESKTPEKPLEMTITPEQKELQRKAEEFSKQQREQEETKNHKPEEKKSKKKKRHRDKTEYSYESGTESESGSDSEPEPAPPGVEDDAEPGSAGMEAGNGEKQQAEEKECGGVRTAGKGINVCAFSVDER